jgi:hypothetical protein
MNAPLAMIGALLGLGLLFVHPAAGVAALIGVFVALCPRY